MAPSREIEKLQRRWQENPLGLTFAPLAEAYRKEGLYADALELLDIGLTQHPNYVPAHIVRGRCHLDTRSDAEAEAAFRRVLDLDPENVIALKGLAETAERSSRFEEAASHLERLLAFDRNNDDAKGLLDRVRSMLATPSPGTIDPEPVLIDGARPGADEPAPAAPEPPAADAGPEPAPPSIEALVVRLEVEEIVADLSAPVETERDIDTPLQGEPVQAGGGEAEARESETLAGEVEAVAEQPDAADRPAEPTESDGVQAEVVDESSRDLEVVLFQPIELTAGDVSEYQVPSDAERLEAQDRSDEPVPDSEAEPAPIRMDDESPEPVAANSEASPPEPQSEAPPWSEPPPEPAPAVGEAEPEWTAAPEPVERSSEPAVEPAPEEPEPVLAESPAAPITPEPVPFGDDTALLGSEPTHAAWEEPPTPLDLDDVGEADLEPEAEQMVSSDGRDTPAEEPELVVTETMAEIFLRQGHRELALAVYTQLAQREPENPRIREAKEGLAQELRPGAAGSGLPVYAAALTGGQSVRGFFDQLLGMPGPDEPTEGPSLGAVFGAARTEIPEPEAEGVEPGPSYDEFFRGGAEPGAIPRASASPPPEPNPGTGSDAEDIEEFNAWLRGLKR